MGIMGVFGFIWNVITFPFRLFFRKKETPAETAPPTYEQRAAQYPTAPYTATDVGLENVRAKIDLMVTQIDNLKIEYESINQRIQNIERMIREIYAMAKS